MRKQLLFSISLLLSISITLTLCLPTVIKANAEIEYDRIITEDTPFYSDALGSTLLFYLPYTYYVKVLERGESYTHVECFGKGSSIAMDGYVPTDMLFYDGLSVQNPYLEKQITTITTAVLYADKDLTYPIQYIFSSRTLKYYGQIPTLNGSSIFYVSYNNKLGYVQESQITPFEIPLHPNELTFLTPELPPEENVEESPTTQPENGFTVRIIVVVCLLLAGLVALFIAVKNKPKRQINGGYYDENEYE